MKLTDEELNRVRQWFNAMEDMAPGYVEEADRALYRKVIESLGMVPAHLHQQKEKT